MRSGKLRHRVHVEIPTETGKDSHGAPIIEWRQSRYWQCEMQQLSDSQREIANQLYSDATHELHGRWFPGLEKTARFNKGGRLLYIRNIENIDERNRDFRIIVAEDR